MQFVFIHQKQDVLVLLVNYEMNDPSDWTGGCKPTFSITCNASNSEQVKFVGLPRTDFYGFGAVYMGVLADDRVEVELTKFVRVMKSRILDLEEPWPEDIIDPRLQGKFNKNQAAVLIEIGLACVEEDRTRRPTMDSVVQTLLKYEDKFITYQSR
uniref:Serine-threonine/tyrosine-protein kinase catalytic domain-containing protein n=1 Tax=Daucus carota subsp. sativus TaxID=79200 RepID=A0A166AR69_DAUCS